MRNRCWHLSSLVAEVARGSQSLVSPLFYIIQTLSFDDFDRTLRFIFELTSLSSNYRKETFEDANLYNLLNYNAKASVFVLVEG
jgi:hypothetical protein